MNVDNSKFKSYSAPLLRTAMSLVFLWFGTNQLLNPAKWVGFIPDFVKAIGPAETFVIGNGTLEVVLGTLLLLGFFVRIVSLVLALHLIGIVTSVGYDPTGVRDFGLMLATFAVFFNGNDRWCLTHLVKKK